METNRGKYAIGQKAIERSWKATLDRTQLIIYLNSNSLKSACRRVYGFSAARRGANCLAD